MGAGMPLPVAGQVERNAKMQAIQAAREVVEVPDQMHQLCRATSACTKKEYPDMPLRPPGTKRVDDRGTGMMLGILHLVCCLQTRQ